MTDNSKRNLKKCMVARRSLMFQDEDGIIVSVTGGNPKWQLGETVTNDTHTWPRCNAWFISRHE